MVKNRKRKLNIRKIAANLGKGYNETLSQVEGPNKIENILSATSSWHTDFQFKNREGNVITVRVGVNSFGETVVTPQDKSGLILPEKNGTEIKFHKEMNCIVFAPFIPEEDDEFKKIFLLVDTGHLPDNWFEMDSFDSEGGESRFNLNGNPGDPAIDFLYTVDLSGRILELIPKNLLNEFDENTDQLEDTEAILPVIDGKKNPVLNR